MQIGIIGLMRMGANKVLRDKHSCGALDTSPDGDRARTDKALSAMRHAFGGHVERQP